ncbi:MAG: hypothetical protein M1608_08355 [Candidatus Omnitrophica bacterium]|nr:hypothetical protein [Candidatus Omnitrophota bacterium]
MMLVVMAGALAAARAATYQEEVLADSPLVYYPMDETDGTTAQNLGSLGPYVDGTYSDTTTMVLLGQNSASAGLGTAVKLASGYIDVPDLGQGPLDQVSIELWINRQSDPASGEISAIYTTAWAGNGLHMNLKNATPAGPQFEFAIPAGGAHPQFFPMWPTNEWHYLVVTRDGTTSAVRVYLDGKFVSEGIKDAAPEFTEGEIGAWNGGRNLNALVDEFAIYPTVLSEDRIAAHFQAAQLSLDPPEIVLQPQGATLYPGDHITLSAAARGQALAFQWFKDDLAITGASNYSYTIDPITLADAGSYALQVSNVVGSVKSTNAILTVSGGTKPISLISYFTFDTGSVTNTSELRNEVVGRQNGIFRDATAGFAPAPAAISTEDKVVGDGALQLEGNTFLQLLEESSLNGLPAYTFAAWVKVMAVGVDPVVGIYSPDSFPQAGTLQITADNNGQVQATYDGGGDRVLVTPTPSDWFHLAFTHDAAAGVTNAVLYINGVAVGTNVADIPGDLGKASSLGSIGWGSRLWGLIDDMRIYDGALTADKIAALPGLAAEPVTLSFSRSGDKLTLTWNFTDFILQQNDSLTNPVGWTDVAGGNTSPVTVTIGAGAKYFRLKK